MRLADWFECWQAWAGAAALKRSLMLLSLLLVGCVQSDHLVRRPLRPPGQVDSLSAAGITAFGPTAAAAQLEGSKAFMKNLCRWVHTR